MKVLNLCCDEGHAFEGWFGSEADFQDQVARAVLQCPLCSSASVTRLPSAPRLNLSGARDAAVSAPPAAPAHSAASPAPAAAGTDVASLPPAARQALWMQAVAHVLKQTEDVGERFPEEARRIHYGEAEQRNIRGQASPQQREALAEEGIEVVAIPLPDGMTGPAH